MYVGLPSEVRAYLYESIIRKIESVVFYLTRETFTYCTCVLNGKEYETFTDDKQVCNAVPPGMSIKTNKQIFLSKLVVFNP